MNNELRGIIVEETGNVGIGGANRVMNNERKPITRTIKGTEPWMPDQVWVWVWAWNQGEEKVERWLIKPTNRKLVNLCQDEDGNLSFFKHVEPIYEPAPKKTRLMTPLEAYVFLRDGGYIFKHKDYLWNVWNTPGVVRYNFNVQDMHYAIPKEPLEWHEFPEVEVEVE